MGARHAASGVAAAAVTLPVAVHVGANPTVWAAVWVGAAMLPDMDSSGSHAARVWGWPTRTLGGVLGRVAGGHRESTHDIIVAPIAAAAFLSAVAWWRPGATFALALMLGICLRMIVAKRVKVARNPLVNMAVSVTAAWFLTGAGPMWWLPFVTAGGIIVHILCDSVTSEGAPLPVAWIWDKKARSIQWGAKLFRTGSPVEAAFGPIFYGAALIAVTYWTIQGGWLGGVAGTIVGAASR